MSEEEKPKVTKATRSKQYTEITFKPDLARFGMKELDDDTVAIFKRRVYDVAGVTDDSVKVYWNGEKLNVRSFSDYVKLFEVCCVFVLLIGREPCKTLILLSKTAIPCSTSISKWPTEHRLAGSLL